MPPKNKKEQSQYRYDIFVYWLPKSKSQRVRDNICDHFGVTSEMSVNGETKFDIDRESTTLLAELMGLEDKQYLKIRFKPCEN